MEWLVPFGVGLGGLLAGIVAIWSRGGRALRSLPAIGLALPALTAIAFGLLIVGHDLAGGTSRTVAAAVWPSTGLLLGAGTLFLDRVPWHRLSARAYAVALATLGLAAFVGLAITSGLMSSEDGLGAGTQSLQVTVASPGNGTVHVAVPFPEANSPGAQRTLDRLSSQLADEGAGERGGYGDQPAKLLLATDDTLHMDAEVDVYGSKDARKAFEEYRFRSLELSARSHDPQPVNVTMTIEGDDGPTRTCFLEPVRLTAQVQTPGGIHEANVTTMTPTGRTAADGDLRQAGWPIACQQ